MTDTGRLFDPVTERITNDLDKVTLSARVGADLRERVLEHRAPGELQSDVVRRLLELALDTLDAGARAMTAPGTARRRDPSTSRHAAGTVRAGTARFEALRELVASGERGMTADDVVVALLPRPLNSTARRVTDLLQAGLIEPLRWIEEVPGNPRAGVHNAERAILNREEPGHDSRGRRVVTRPSRTGKPSIVYVATRAGANVLELASR